MNTFFPSALYFYEVYDFDHQWIQIPTGALLSVSVVFSNSAAVLLSVAFVNMLKSHLEEHKIWPEQGKKWLRSYELGWSMSCFG